ncbi:MAG: helix-turn-helix domain-containing protein [Prevotella sp.]|nr:helix-turn-helix domain-containing protein [Prevotella sp.]MBQ8457920.1 helix-turn-helix domain-containing protein [Prevotella sp.]
MIKNAMVNESPMVTGMQDALAQVEQMLDGEKDVKILLAQQLIQQKQNEERIDALEGIFLCQKEILNFDEAAAYLSMSKSTLYKLTAKKEIPHYKPNRFVFFERSELDNWIRSAAVKTEEHLDDQVNANTLANPLRM